MLTFTATADLFETERFVRRWRPSFPVFVSNLVAHVPNYFEATGGNTEFTPDGAAAWLAVMSRVHESPSVMGGMVMSRSSMSGPTSV